MIYEVYKDLTAPLHIWYHLAIGIGCSLALFGVKIIRGIIWGA